MNTEDRIRQSALRISARQNTALHVPANPRKARNIYWGWIATPAAAIAGIVVGMSLQATTDHQAMPLTQANDTVFVHDVRHDTLWQTRVEEKERVITKERTAASPVRESNRPVLAEAGHENESEPPVTGKHDLNACTSVSCDGIDYAMLASN